MRRRPRFTANVVSLVFPAFLAACGSSAPSQEASDGGNARDAVGQDAPLSDVQTSDVVVMHGDGGVNVCTPTFGDGICGAAVCGNGVIDSCQQCEGPGGPGQGGGDPGGPGGPPFGDGGCTTVSEQCDGTQLAGGSCTALGYAGGSLVCSSGCTWDASSCSTCAPTSDGAGCTLAPQAEGVSLGMSATEIGLAWIAHGGGCDGVRFDRYAPGQPPTRTGESACLSSCDVDSVAVASTPTGWLVAFANRSELRILSLDGAGAVRGSPRVIAGADAPLFASNPGGPPLLEYSVAPHQDTYVAVLADDGTELHPSALAFSSSVEAHRGDAIFAGDGFLVAERAMIGRDTIGVRHVAMDGTLGPAQTPAPGYAEYPQLAWTGTEGRLVYAQFSSAQDGMYWTRIDGTGATLGGAVLVGAYPQVYQRAPIVAEGTDTLALIGPQAGLQLVHVSAAGVVGAPTTIEMNSIAEQKMILAGGHAYASWLEDCGMQSFVQDAPGNLMGRAVLRAIGP
jgi:hypothetical protein